MKTSLINRKSHPAEYNAWNGMKSRCYNKNSPKYHNYGGRGISVCDEWRDDFVQFVLDVGNKPAPGLQLSRRDVNRGYDKDNCAWGTHSMLSFNRRTLRNNTSGVCGVSFCKKVGKWRSVIDIDGKQISLGRSESFLEACCIRKSAEHKFFGKIKE